MTQLLSTIMLGVIFWGLYRAARTAAELSVAAKRYVLLGGVGGIILGVLVCVVLPRYVRDTPGSPAALVFITLIWLIGGLFIATGIPAIIGALLAKPQLDPPEA